MPEFTLIIQAAFIIAFVVDFGWASTWEGMINHWFARATDHWPPWIKKPLYDCPICAAFWWGAFMLMVWGQSTGFWFQWYEAVPVLFMAGGINVVVAYVVSADKEIVKELKD